MPGLHRYDHIYASWPNFRVNDVRYLYEEACAAGSDHALVVADLEADTEHGPRREIDDLLPTALLAVVFLVSPAGGYITGKIIEVDGGIDRPNFDLGIPDL